MLPAAQAPEIRVCRVQEGIEPAPALVLVCSAQMTLSSERGGRAVVAA